MDCIKEMIFSIRNLENKQVVNLENKQVVKTLFHLSLPYNHKVGLSEHMASYNSSEIKSLMISLCKFGLP